MSPESSTDLLVNATYKFNLPNQTHLISESPLGSTSTAVKPILKPSVVETNSLKQSIIVKPSSKTDRSVTASCIKTFCCYDFNIASQNVTMKNNPIFCQEKDDNQSENCRNISLSCQIPGSGICAINKTGIKCRVDLNCGGDNQLNCSLRLINADINPNSSTTITTTGSPTVAISKPTTNITTNPSTLSTSIASNSPTATTTTTTTAAAAAAATTTTTTTATAAATTTIPATTTITTPAAATITTMATISTP